MSQARLSNSSSRRNGGARNGGGARRDRDIFDYTKPWVDASGKSEFDPSEVEGARWTIASNEWGGNPYNKGKWKSPITKPRNDGSTRTTYCCCFRNERDCKFQFCSITSDSKTKFYIGSRDHDHSAYNKKRGCSAQVLIDAVPSPSKLQKGPTQLLRRAVASNPDTVLDVPQQRNAIRQIGKLKKEFHNTQLEDGNVNDLGGLRTKLNGYRKSTIEAAGEFDENSVYLCGDQYICETTEDGQNYVAAILATENLLLNVYRQECSGIDLTLSVDFSYRLNHEKFGLMPVMTVDMSQKGHVVAYGLANHEDTATHKFLFEMLKKEVELVVNKYFGQGRRPHFANRDDNHRADLYPALKDKYTWEMKPLYYMTLIKDGAEAAANAALEVFCDGDEEKLHVGMCHTHVSMRWTKKKKFEDPDNEKLFAKDLDYAIKDLPHIGLCGLQGQLFLEKWIELGEEHVATAWDNEWGDKNVSRVEMNQPDVSPLGGGIPADNNIVEARNNGDKDCLGRRKEHVVIMIDNVANNILKPLSVCDVSYCDALKRNSKHSNESLYRNKAVLHGGFFRQCYEVLEKYKYDEPCFMNVCFGFKRENDGFPDKSGILLSRKGFKDCVESEEWDDENEGELTPRRFKSFLRAQGWLKTYENLLIDPEEAAKKEKENGNELDFDLLQDYLTTFHCIIPVKYSDWEGAMAVRHWLEMLRLSGIPVMSFEEIQRRKKTLYSCNCSTYMHYTMCVHTFCTMKAGGIITGWPENMDPTPIVKPKKKATGRPNSAIKKGKRHSLNRD